ncbi:MAG TPA: hypothetical protein VLE74_02855 [Candidatus Saccharimonadales bacterium]|nr:hypothetical protein [Candidatus Saccharimonadales bacterium]
MEKLPSRKNSEAIEEMTDEQIQIFAETMANPEAAIARLPEEEQKKYEEAQHSIVEARRFAEAEGRKIWII